MAYPLLQNAIQLRHWFASIRTGVGRVDFHIPRPDENNSRLVSSRLGSKRKSINLCRIESTSPRRIESADEVRARDFSSKGLKKVFGPLVISQRRELFFCACDLLFDWSRAMRRVITLYFGVQAKTRSTNRTRASRHLNFPAILGRSFVPRALNVAVSHTIIGPRETVAITAKARRTAIGRRRVLDSISQSKAAKATAGVKVPKIACYFSHAARECQGDRPCVRVRGFPIRERGLVPWTILGPKNWLNNQNPHSVLSWLRTRGRRTNHLRGATGTSRGKEQKPVMHPSGRHNRTNKSKWLLSPLSLPFSTRPPWSPPARPPTPTP